MLESCLIADGRGDETKAALESSQQYDDGCDNGRDEVGIVYLGSDQPSLPDYPTTRTTSAATMVLDGPLAISCHTGGRAAGGRSASVQFSGMTIGGFSSSSDLTLSST